MKKVRSVHISNRLNSIEYPFLVLSPCVAKPNEAKLLLQRRKSLLCSHLSLDMLYDKYLSWVSGVDRKICHEGH